MLSTSSWLDITSFFSLWQIPVSHCASSSSISPERNPRNLKTQTPCHRGAAGRLTVSDDAQDGQVHQALPVGALLQRDAVARGGEDVAAADGDQLAAVVSARHVVQHRRVVDEGVQLPAGGGGTRCHTSKLDKFTVPGLEGDQRVHDAGLMVLGHVLMHVRVVLPDVALGAAVGDRPEAKRRRVGVRTLELQREKHGRHVVNGRIDGRNKRRGTTKTLGDKETGRSLRKKKTARKRETS
ncbi:hypothetical protein EYF80_013875 [Liparis tanakae]|uniref:Uncharacterized protein n=1 Tax=Liparis tanakae TaxID=230148 RepID=A0A4Z2IEB9_9TELE|nr:hypothetical protein EYF80_013875 [Liparis tanakae]